MPSVGEHYKKNVDADEADQKTGGVEVEHHRKSVGRKYKRTPKFEEINKKTGEVLLSAICLNSGYTSRIMVFTLLVISMPFTSK